MPTVGATPVGGVRISAVRAQLGEGAIWDAARRRLLFVDINRSRIYRYSPASGELDEYDLSAHTQHVSTVAPVEARQIGSSSGASGTLDATTLQDAASGEVVIVGTTDGIALYNFRTKAYTAHPANGFLAQYERMNDGKCDPYGRFWVGSVAKTGPDGPSAAPLAGAAALWVLDGWAAAPAKALNGVTISNGLSWSAAKDTMWYIDSSTLEVDAFNFQGPASPPATPVAGALGTAAPPSAATAARARRRAVRVTTAASKSIPDGCCLDMHGCLWVAVFGAGEVRRYDPRSGEHLGTVELPVAAGVESTSCAFGGEDMATLYVTTACKFWPAEKMAELHLGGRLFRVDKEALAALGEGIRGAPTHCFAL